MLQKLENFKEITLEANILNDHEVSVKFWARDGISSNV